MTKSSLEINRLLLRPRCSSLSSMLAFGMFLRSQSLV
jgi:hypothetical protein